MEKNCISSDFFLKRLKYENIRIEVKTLMREDGDGDGDGDDDDGDDDDYSEGDDGDDTEEECTK